MTYSVIALDIDGTLTNSQKMISPETKNALLAAQNQGARLVLASGRPSSGMLAYAQELDMDKHHGLLVSYNGAKVLDCQTGQVLFEQSMTAKQAKAVLEHVKQFHVMPMIAKDSYLYVNNVYADSVGWQRDGQEVNIVQYEARGGNFKLCEIEDLADFVNFPLEKILLAAEGTYLQAHYQDIAAPFEGQLNSMFTADFYYEFTDLGVDKAKALDQVLRPLGYQPEDMIAFGDGQNDASMLAYAGRAVAMGNAVQEIKDLADETTLSNDQDGIAYSLKNYFNN